MPTMKKKPFISFLSLIWTLMICLVFFRDIRTILGQMHTYPLGGLVTFLLVGCLFFGMLHFVSFIDHLLRSLFLYDDSIGSRPSVDASSPRVAVFVPVYNEDPHIVESCITTCAEISYPNFIIYLLDDSTDEAIQESNRRISRRFGVRHLHREHRRGFKAGAINNAIGHLDDDVQYLLVIDADQRVKPHILADLIPVLESNPSLSFIQTPQFFHARSDDIIGISYSYQQHIYNKHICRGLNVNCTVMLTGSNSLFRLSRLRAVGGMDESCITEDIATSFTFYARGYHGAFLDTVYAEGIAPPTISAYYTQQLRWAYGTIQLLRTVVRTFVNHPRLLSPLQWLEFAINGSCYLLGGTNLILFLLPCATLLLGIRILPVVLPAIFIPSLVTVLGTQFGISIRERNYHLRDLLASQVIFNSLSFIYTRAIWYVLSGRDLHFQVTPKKASPSTPGRAVAQIAPLLFVLAAVSAAILVGIRRLLDGGVTDSSTTIPLFWACYTFVILGSFLPVWARDRKTWRVQGEGRAGTASNMQETGRQRRRGSCSRAATDCLHERKHEEKEE